MISYSEDQARAFVTDAGTLQRGHQLAQPTKWQNVGRTDATAWGECAGSGAKPYLTGIDLSEPAFKCSCPSRVFPCKHGAGLLLLLARQPALFAAATPPAWLDEWLAKRQQTQTKKVEQAPPRRPVESAAPVDDAAVLDPASAGVPGSEVAPARLARMAQGADELEAWLLDLLRHGLATLDQQPTRFWENQAARLVDNQLPGLAGALRALATLRHTHADWAARLLARLGEVYWLVRAFQNHAQLPAATRQEVLQQVGIALKKEDLAAYGAPVADEWRVVGQYSWEEDRLMARRSWLRGLATGRYALVLEFAFGSQPFATPLVPHGRYPGELLFYPGSLPLRAAPVALAFAGSAPGQAPPAAQPPGQLLTEYARALAGQSWLREWPVTLAQVVPVRQPTGSWLLAHPTDPVALPLRFSDSDVPWRLLALTGGQPVTLFGEWDGRAFRPLGTWPARPAEAVAPVPQPGEVATAPAPPARAFPPFSQLLRMALLGTRQSGEALPLLSGVISSADSPEQQLLLAAGALALVQKAGFQPPRATTAPPAPAPADTWQPLGPLGAECFRALLDDNRYAAFRPDYWQQMAQHRRLVPPALLVAALRSAAFRQQPPESLLVLLGERGRWLAQQNPGWRSVLASQHSAEDVSIWETGTLPQRKRFMQQLHRTDPERARQLLVTALPAEPAATQAALLEELEPTLTAADAALLSPYLTARSKEVRQTVVPLLVRLPGSDLLERLWQRAVPLLSLKRPLLGRNKLQVELPASWDKSWQADGIEQKTGSIEGGERASWLGQLLALLPPGRWAAHFGVSAEELLDLAEATEWRTLLLRAWARAAYLHREKAFAPSLLLRHFTQPTLLAQQQVAHLMSLLSEEEKLTLLRAQLPPRPSEALSFLPEFLAYLTAPWPAEVVQAALHFVATVLAPGAVYYYSEPYQRLSALLSRLASCLPENQLPQCAQVLEPLAVTYPPVTTLVEQLLEAVRFRQQLTASLTEPSIPSLF